MLKPPTVWIVSNTDKNIEHCRSFGSPQTVLYRPSGDLIRDLEFVSNTIKNQFQKNDFLNLVGHPIFVAEAYKAALSVHPEINVLVWDKKFMKYDVYVIADK